MYRMTILLALILAPAAFACSIFTAAQGDTVLVGNNEDYWLDAQPVMWVTPGTEGQHGRVCFGFGEGKRPFAQGGINDQGLCFDAAVAPVGDTRRIKGKPKAPDNMGDAMLAANATVSDALTWLEQFDCRLLAGGHLLLADASGDAAVVELHEGALKVFRRKTKSFVGATNFAFSDPALGNYPCPRFAKIDAHFSNGGAITPVAFRDLLAAVAQPRAHSEKDNRDGGTLYSNVYELKSRTVTLYRNQEFDKPVALSLEELLAGGERTLPLEAL